MPIKQTSRYCRTCQRQTLHGKSVVGVGWGCLLTVVTAGLFLPLWLLIGMNNAMKPYLCQVCGGKRFV